MSVSESVIGCVSVKEGERKGVHMNWCMLGLFRFSLPPMTGLLPLKCYYKQNLLCGRKALLNKSVV